MLVNPVVTFHNKYVSQERVCHDCLLRIVVTLMICTTEGALTLLIAQVNGLRDSSADQVSVAPASYCSRIIRWTWIRWKFWRAMSNDWLIHRRGKDTLDRPHPDDSGRTVNRNYWKSQVTGQIGQTKIINAKNCFNFKQLSWRCVFVCLFLCPKLLDLILNWWHDGYALPFATIG